MPLGPTGPKQGVRPPNPAAGAPEMLCLMGRSKFSRDKSPQMVMLVSRSALAGPGQGHPGGRAPT